MHREARALARREAMVRVDAPFDVVVTSNSGYPLDQNLYQAVKGMHAAMQVVQQDGLIVAAARCNDGFPAHGNFKKLLVEHRTPQAILDTVLAPGFSMFDQWEAQMLAMILVRARAGLYSEIPADELRRAHVEPVADVGARLGEELRHAGRDAPVAVLPEGPMTIPYLR
jgi:nickel-dependent lactate racemase